MALKEVKYVVDLMVLSLNQHFNHKEEFLFDKEEDAEEFVKNGNDFALGWEAYSGHLLFKYYYRGPRITEPATDNNIINVTVRFETLLKVNMNIKEIMLSEEEFLYMANIVKNRNYIPCNKDVPIICVG